MKKNTYIIILLLQLVIYLSLSIPLNSTSMWGREIVNFERSQYKGGFQNWMITQSNNKWMYFANSNGLLEFDGVNWTTYPIRNNILRSAKFLNNKIYVGGSSEFGYFMIDAKGALTYHSLSEKAKNWGGEIWNIEQDKSNIYFLGERYMHIYNEKNGGLVTLRTEKKIDCSVVYDGVLYLGTSDGIFYLSDHNRLVFMKLSESLKGDKIISLLPYKDQILVTTAKSGLYLMNATEIKKLQTVADDFVRENQLFSTAVQGSKIALGSVQSGVLVFDLDDPNYKEMFNLDNGLKNNTVLSCYFDEDKNLWLGLDKGLSYINLNSPIRPLFATISPIGTGYASMRYQGDIYLGTNQALYKLLKNGRYELVKDSEGQIWSLDIIDDKLFASGDNGVLIISPTEKYKISIPGAWETRALKGRKDLLIVATYSGFHVLKFENNKWVYSHKMPDFTDSTRGFIEDDEPNTFWSVNTNSKIQRVTYNPSLDKKISQKEYHIQGTDFDANVVFRIIDNNITVCSRNGIFQYSRISDSFDRYTQLESMLEGAKYYEFLYLDQFNNIWFVSDNNLKMRPFSEGKYAEVSYHWGLSSVLINGYENVYMLDNETAIVAVDNAFVRIDLSVDKNKTLPRVATQIRDIVYSKNDSILCFGNSDESLVLPYDLNSIKINFSTTCYQFAKDVVYSYRLKGADNEWSLPSAYTEKEYTNLKEGKYVFEVKSYIEGKPDSENIASISFEIRPPWYRSLWANIFYTFVFLLFLFFVYRKTIGKQKKIIHQKGEELINQTKRFEEETKQKDQEIYELHNKNLQNELSYKTQELNGYILNILRKNEILEDVKKNAFNISKAIDENKQPNVIKQRIMHLITQINDNIEHDIDFKVFESNFDIIHQDFFKLLDESFSGLTRNDKVLCAYLKMNLSSKEIAPLLNISVRGVEVNRYRLRKKMNLDRDVNLSEYLNNLK